MLARIRAAITAAVLRWISAGELGRAAAHLGDEVLADPLGVGTGRQRRRFVDERRAAGEDEHVARQGNVAQRLGGDATGAAGGQDDQGVEPAAPRDGGGRSRDDGTEHRPDAVRIGDCLATTDELELLHISVASRDSGPAGSTSTALTRNDGRSSRRDLSRPTPPPWRLRPRGALASRPNLPPRVLSESTWACAAILAANPRSRRNSDFSWRKSCARQEASGASTGSQGDPAAARWMTPAIVSMPAPGPASHAASESSPARTSLPISVEVQPRSIRSEATCVARPSASSVMRKLAGVIA